MNTNQSKTKMAAGDPIDNNPEEQVRVAQGDVKLYEYNCSRWLLAIKANVGRELFNHMQFINSTETEQFGSIWQESVCNVVGVPMDARQDFWNNRKGKQMARSTINRRRMNATMAMKKKFQGRRSDMMGEVLVLVGAPPHLEASNF